MKKLAFVLVAPLLGGCAIASVASTAVDIATLPVKAAKTTVNAASAGVDAVTTSQSEQDQKDGRRLREQDELRGASFGQWPSAAAKTGRFPPTIAPRSLASDQSAAFATS